MFLCWKVNSSTNLLCNNSELEESSLLFAPVAERLPAHAGHMFFCKSAALSTCFQWSFWVQLQGACWARPKLLPPISKTGECAMLIVHLPSNNDPDTTYSSPSFSLDLLQRYLSVRHMGYTHSLTAESNALQETDEYPAKVQNMVAGTEPPFLGSSSSTWPLSPCCILPLLFI